MLVGTILGIIIALLIFAVVYLKGANRAYEGQINKLTKEQLASDESLARLTANHQTLASIMARENVVYLTDQQINQLGSRLAVTIKTVLNEQTEAALAKLN
jgi:hypothetical protein